jgi:8-amino-7-oxononanoate synthase
MAIAEFKRQESAIVFTSGYMANIGLITSLADKDALILSDAFNHASIVDGCTLSKAKVIVYPHLDFRYVDRMLKENTNHKRRFIITESIFSMDGDIAPLPKLIEISKKSDATLIVDDAHAIGVLGKTGRGGLEYFALDEKDYIVVGTMSKAIGSIGGFVAGSNWIVEFIKNKARTLIYTTALPPIVCAAGICGIKLIEKEGWRRTKLIENISYIKKGLSKIGFSINSLPVPIIPIVIGNTRKALKLASYLWENKIFAPAIKPPTVPEGMCRIRLSISALFDKKHLSLLLEVLSKAIKII